VERNHPIFAKINQYNSKSIDLATVFLRKKVVSNCVKQPKKTIFGITNKKFP
jgi:hypothetical protein